VKSLFIQTFFFGVALSNFSPKLDERHLLVKDILKVYPYEGQCPSPWGNKNKTAEIC
jgi:hypothetical protein